MAPGRFKSWFAVTALLLAAACENSAPERSNLTAEKDGDPLIYQVTNADGATEGWLMGTIHALPDGTHWKTENVREVIETADLLIVEVAELNNQSAISAAFNRLSSTPGQGPLKQRIDPSLHADLQQMFERSDYGPTDFISIEDWAAAIMLARVDAAGDPDNGVDKALLEEFEGRKVIGLESAAAQLGIFDRLAAADQKAMLEGTIKEWRASRKNPTRLVDAWLDGDVATLEETTTSGIMEDPELRAALLTSRNDNWMVPIEKMLEQEPRPLVAVGAAHLIGPDGLAAQLEERGYTVTRME